MPVRPDRFAAPVHRVFAAGCAALVLALTIFAASPIAHDWLHFDGNGPKGSDDGCAVVLFANGVSGGLEPIDAPRPEISPAPTPPAMPAEVVLVAPRYLRQPERGPPAACVS